MFFFVVILSRISWESLLCTMCSPPSCDVLTCCKLNRDPCACVSSDAEGREVYSQEISRRHRRAPLTISGIY